MIRGEAYAGGGVYIAERLQERAVDGVGEARIVESDAVESIEESDGAVPVDTPNDDGGRIGGGRGIPADGDDCGIGAVADPELDIGLVDRDRFWSRLSHERAGCEKGYEKELYFF